MGETTCRIACLGVSLSVCNECVRQNVSATVDSVNSISYSSNRFLYGVFYHHCSGDQIEKDEMDGACSAYGGEQRCIRGFGGGT